MDNFFMFFMTTLYHPVRNQAYKILSSVQHTLSTHQYAIFHDIFTKFFRKKIEIHFQTKRDLADFLRDIIPKGDFNILDIESVRIVLKESKNNYRKKLTLHQKCGQTLQKSYENWRLFHTQPFPLPKALFQSYCMCEKKWETEQIRYHKAMTNLRDAQKICIFVQKIARSISENEESSDIPTLF